MLDTVLTVADLDKPWDSQWARVEWMRPRQAFATPECQALIAQADEQAGTISRLELADLIIECGLRSEQAWYWWDTPAVIAPTQLALW